jgi:CBS-domain-containing membrane protein
MISGDDDERMVVDDPNLRSQRQKRWRVYCDGQLVETYDTVREAWEGYAEHRNKILPVMLKTLKRVKGVYSFRDWSKMLNTWSSRKSRKVRRESRYCRPTSSRRQRVPNSRNCASSILSRRHVLRHTSRPAPRAASSANLCRWHLP